MQNYKSFILPLILLAIFSSNSMAQNPVSVWPGDVNNNGIVNNVDALYLGQAIGLQVVFGTPRDSVDIGWFGHNTQAWNSGQLNGLDLAYADCDGDGTLTLNDSVAIYQNYGLTHGPVFPDSLNSGTGTGAPMFMRLAAGNDTVGLSDTIIVEIVLGSPQVPVTAFGGMVYSIVYDTSLVNQDGVFFNQNTSWISPGLTALEFQKHSAQQGRIDVAVSLVNGITVTGQGVIGTMLLVIEDNLIDKVQQDELLQISLEDILMVDNQFNIQTVAPQDLNIIVAGTDDKFAELIEWQLYPNPSNELVRFQSNISELITDIEIWSPDGRLFKQIHLDMPQQNGVIDLSGLMPGIYFVRASSEDKTGIKSLIIY